MSGKCIAIDSWAGRRYYPVSIVGETPKRFRVRVLADGGIPLPSRRYAAHGEIIAVPKYAVRDIPEYAE